MQRSGNTICCVVGCCNTYGNTTALVKLYSFPARPHELERRKIWINSINRLNNDGTLWQPNKSSRICSEHFVGGSKSGDPRHPSFNPTLFPCQYKRKAYSNADIVRFNRWKKRKTESVLQTQSSTEMSCSNNFTVESDAVKKYDKEIQVVSFEKIESPFEFFCQFNCQPNTVSTQACISPSSFVGSSCISKKDQMVGTDPILSPNFNGYPSIKGSKQLKSLTGVREEVFKLLFDMLPVFKCNKVSAENRLLICLMKIKTGLPFDAIAPLFNVDSTTIARIFHEILVILANKTKNFVFWPSKEAVQLTMPPAFKLHYPNCRVIIDCTEIRTEQPGPIKIRNHLYSNYKSGYTIKFLVGITPSGMISFKSQCYGGRASDPFITNDSGFLKLLEPGDVIMADKGFPHIQSSISIPNAIVVTPPFLHAGKLTDEEITETFNIASVRIHVERCISRIKIYNILNKISTDLLYYIDDIVHLCCVLTNLQTPIIKT